jgi:endonuclease I
MDDVAYEKRLAENQVVFRSFNESVQQGIDHANEVAREENAAPLKLNEDAPLHFYCECSNEKCNQRIRVTPRDYKTIHASRESFSIAYGHEIKEVERVTSMHEGYCVVTKYKEPEQDVKELKETGLNERDT